MILKKLCFKVWESTNRVPLNALYETNFIEIKLKNIKQFKQQILSSIIQRP